VDRVLSDRSLNARIVEAGRSRVEQLALPTTSEALLGTLSSFLVRQEA
jgi:hypothetical protein